MSRKRETPAPILMGGAAELRPTSEADLQAAAVSLDRRNKRPKSLPVQVSLGENGRLNVGPSIDDTEVYVERLLDACGTRSKDWAAALLKEIANVDGGGKNIAVPVQAGLAFLNGLQPRDEVESALGAQMFAAHRLAMHMAFKASGGENFDWIKMAADQMNKASRTYIAGVEALARLRSGGKQQVEVRYVYVQGNAVIGDVHTGRPGGGAIPDFLPQPHEQLPHAPGAPGPSMWSADESGRELPGAGHIRPEEMSAARRTEPGSAEGTGERQLAPRNEDAGDAPAQEAHGGA
jgi:hypothetical protein